MRTGSAGGKGVGAEESGLVTGEASDLRAEGVQD